LRRVRCNCSARPALAGAAGRKGPRVAGFTQRAASGNVAMTGVTSGWRPALGSDLDGRSRRHGDVHALASGGTPQSRFFARLDLDGR
jgi:hypothetical protein